jgi:hypothetical protein
MIAEGYTTGTTRTNSTGATDSTSDERAQATSYEILISVVLGSFADMPDVPVIIWEEEPYRYTRKIEPAKRRLYYPIENQPP